MTTATTSRAPRPWWVAVISGMASYIDATAIVSFGGAMLIYQGVMGLSPAEIGLASAGLTLGIAVGALIGGRLGDRIGRRPVFIATMVVIVATAVGLSLADSFTVVAVCALLLGLATGADLPVSLASISEAASDENRGKLIGFSQILWSAGFIVSTFLVAAIANLGRLGAQILFLHIAIVALLILVGRFTIPESDAWMQARNERRQGIKTVRADHVAVLDLVRGSYKVPFLALLGFYALTNLAANTSGQFGSYLLVNVGGVNLGTAALIGLPLIPLGVFAALWFMKIADTPKRFGYFTFGAISWVVAQLVYAVFGVSLTTAIISGVIGIAGTAFAFESIMKVWTQEQFPALLRSTAQGTIIAVARLLAAVLAIFTPILLQFNARFFYLGMAVVIATGCGIAWAAFRTRDQRSEIDVEAQLDPAADEHMAAV